MSGFGRALRLTTFGESHGGAVGGVLDGCPPGLTLDTARVQAALNRRRPGQSALTTSRAEPDQLQWLSGLFEGRLLGTSLAFAVRNKDADPSAYTELADTFRPSHADYTYEAKYGLRAWAGGGRASARETLARVAAGAVALQILEDFGPVRIVAWVDRVHDIQASIPEVEGVTAEDVEKSLVRCPDLATSAAMEARILEMKEAGDSVGGTIKAVATGLPAGLGEPVFDKLEADLGKAMLSLPAAKGFSIGSGFAGTWMTGREHNDAFVPTATGIGTATNRSGGIQGGISNGMPILLEVGFKPTSTVFHAQGSVDREGRPTVVKPRGRHDPCVLPRAVPIVEAMFALVLADHWLRWRGQCTRKE